MIERPYERLVAWKEAHALCLMMYTIMRSFPQEEKYALVNQMRRAAYSVPMNLAEGNARRSSKEKSRYFEIALASLEELHYQSRLSKDLLYLSKTDFEKIDDQLQRTSFLLTKLRQSFR